MEDKMKKLYAFPWYVYAMGSIILLLLSLGPFFLASNPTAQVFFNLFIAILTTFISVQATRHYSENTLQESLTRYGLQAWRTLNSLQVKISQNLGLSDISDTTLQSWIMDVDDSKWAWRDLLRELFELQDRLQIETEEVTERYMEEIAKSNDPAERSNLEQRKVTEIAKLQSMAPLPFKLAESVLCPECKLPLTARVGKNPGDSDWPVCTNCGATFPVFRKTDGNVSTSERTPLTTITKYCPNCENEIIIPLYEDREHSFLVRCYECKTHLQFQGDLENQTLEDLGKENANFECPLCGIEQPCWIAPGRRVSFRTKCIHCFKYVHIQGTIDNFEVGVT